MFRPFKARGGQVEISDLLIHRLSVLDAAISVAEETKDLRSLMSLSEDMEELVDYIIHIYLLTSEEDDSEEEEEEDNDLPRSKQPVGFQSATSKD